MIISSGDQWPSRRHGAITAHIERGGCNKTAVSALFFLELTYRKARTPDAVCN